MCFFVFFFIFRVNVKAQGLLILKWFRDSNLMMLLWILPAFIYGAFLADLKQLSIYILGSWSHVFPYILVCWSLRPKLGWRT